MVFVGNFMIAGIFLIFLGFVLTLCYDRERLLIISIIGFAITVTAGLSLSSVEKEYQYGLKDGYYGKYQMEITTTQVDNVIKSDTVFLRRE